MQASTPSASLASPTSSDAQATKSWRADFVAWLVILAAALVVHHRLVLHPTDILVGVQHQGRNDLTSAFFAFQSYPGLLAARSGEWPWWNPTMLGGTPFFGNPQPALLYLPNWLTRIIQAPCLLSWLLVAHHLGGALGAYCLARRWGFDRRAATLAGVCVVGAPYFVAQTGEGHFNQIGVTAWIPWAWLAWEHLAAGRRRGMAACVATLAMAFFAGHVQEWYYLVGLLGTLTALECVDRWRRRERPGAVRLVRDAVLMMTLTVGVIAVELIPVYLYTTQTVRGGVISAAAGGEISLGLASFRQLLDPLALGGPESYHGPGRFYWETLFHFGWTPLGLAILALVVRRDDPRVWRLALLAGLAIAFAFGDGSPVFSAAHRLIPGVGMFRSPSRSLFFVSLFVPLLAGAALDRLLRRRRSADEPASSGKTSAAAKREPTFEVPLLEFRSLIVAALLVVIVYEETRHANAVLRTLRSDDLRDPRALLALAPSLAAGDRVLAEQSLLSDREACALEVTKLQGYEPVPLVRQVALADAFQPGGDPSSLLLGFQPIDLAKLNPRAVSAAGVRWAIVSPQSGPVPPNWRRAARGTLPGEFTQRGGRSEQIPCEVYENVGAAPRAFAVGEAVEASGLEAVRRLGEIDSRREVILPVDVLAATGAERRASFRAAKLVEARANRMVVDVTLDEPGYLVVQDTWAPGWKARVDGEATTILPANVAARAVALAAGTHRIEFAYWPPGLAAGLVVTLASVLLTAWRSRG